MDTATGTGDDLTALLAQWGEQFEEELSRAVAEECESLERSLSLLAAVEAVLKLAGKLEPQAPPASALEEDRMWMRQECAGMIRAAITAALTGQEAGDAGLETRPRPED
jgi:hypothetical protein